MPHSPDPIDAEFVDVASTSSERIPMPDPSRRPPGGYGRRSVASPLAESLDDIGSVAGAVSNAARSLGAEDAANRLKHAQGLAEAGAETVRASVVAVEGVKRELAPVGSAMERLVARAKAAGIIGKRKEPFRVDVVKRRPWPPKKDGA